MPRPTLKDVAARAGVHATTASRALNPALEGRITAKTTARVKQAAKDLGYVPDPTAQSLRTRRSGSIGVVVPDLTNPVIPPILRGIESVMWGAGYGCLLADTDNDPEREAALIDELRARRCEGLIISSAVRLSPEVQALGREDLPVVLVTRDVDDTGLPFVAGDDASGVRQAVEHLAGLGHRSIAHVTGPQDLSTTAVRAEAFRASAQELGLADAQIRYGSAFTVPSGRLVMQRLLDEGWEGTAVLAGNDLVAIGVLEVMSAAGRSCPKDYSLVGHNDMPLMEHLQPPLTSVSIPQYELGQEAARVLLGWLRGERPETPCTRLLPTALVVRGSTAAAP